MTDDKATPATEPFSMLINAIESDLERTPEGFGGEIHYTPATPGHGGMGHNGDYLLREWREVAAALAAERDRADRAEARLELIRQNYDRWTDDKATCAPLLSAVEIALAPNGFEANA